MNYIHQFLVGLKCLSFIMLIPYYHKISWHAITQPTSTQTRNMSILWPKYNISLTWISLKFSGDLPKPQLPFWGGAQQRRVFGPYQFDPEILYLFPPTDGIPTQHPYREVVPLGRFFTGKHHSTPHLVRFVEVTHGIQPFRRTRGRLEESPRWTNPKKWDDFSKGNLPWGNIYLP